MGNNIKPEQYKNIKVKPPGNGLKNKKKRKKKKNKDILGNMASVDQNIGLPPPQTIKYSMKRRRRSNGHQFKHKRSMNSNHQIHQRNKIKKLRKKSKHRMSCHHRQFKI